MGSIPTIPTMRKHKEIIGYTLMTVLTILGAIGVVQLAKYETVPGTSDAPALNGSAQVEYTEIELPDGRTVECLISEDRLDCNWQGR